MPELTETIIREIYDDFARGRSDRFGQALDDRIDFLSHPPSDFFPYLGRRRGRNEVLEALSELHQKLEIVSYWPLTILVEGQNAALSVFASIKDRSTGKAANFLGAHFLKFQDGQMVEFCGIIDSMDAVRQLTMKNK